MCAIGAVVRSFSGGIDGRLHYPRPSAAKLAKLANLQRTPSNFMARKSQLEPAAFFVMVEIDGDRFSRFLKR